MDKINDIVRDVLDNPQKVLDKNAFSDEQIIEIKKHLNPYKAHVPTDHMKMGLIAYTNLREEYLKRFTMTSFIGFIYRALKEYPHEDEDKEIIQTFLDSFFKFNPDLHVRSADKHASKTFDTLAPTIKNKALDALVLPRPEVTSEHLDCIYACNENINAAVRMLKNRSLYDAITEVYELNIKIKG